MTEFKHLKNFCEFLDRAADFTSVMKSSYENDNEPLPSNENVRETFAEWLYNFMLDDGLDEQTADRLADKLADVFYVPM